MSMEEFHQIFFEEADELIQAMESELLEMVFDADNPDRINNVFRAAHSIKGGAATFGFDEITATTHAMETLMDRVRDGAMAMTRELIDVLLGAVDGVKELLAAARAGAVPDAAAAAAMRAGLEAWLAEPGATGNAGAAPAGPPAGPPAPAQPDDGAVAAARQRHFVIEFRPSRALFRSGNDPLHIFRALRELGDLRVELSPQTVPELDDFVPEELYLAWTLRLDTDAAADAVLGAFEWVDDICEIDLTEIAAAPGTGTDSGPAAVANADASAALRPAGAPARSAAGATPASGEAASIRVGIDKIDSLINLVGELVITQSMLGELGSDVAACDLERLRAGFLQLERHTRELQENVMKIRMVPISSVFNRLPRTVHDLSARLGKKVDLLLHGEHTELDKTVMERIGDPLIHLVRNAVDHGVEEPEARLGAGKAERGVLELRAYHANGDVVIEIRDDGAGLDTQRILDKARVKGLVAADHTPPVREIHELIFHPGFSTADQVSDVSGRGVGMDVVKQNILELGGTVEIDSEAGRGSTFTIRLPLTLAIVDGQLLRVADQVYVIPLVSIIESMQLDAARLGMVVGRGLVYRIRDEYVPVVALDELFRVGGRDAGHSRESLLVLVQCGQGRIGLLVDDLLAQQQVVIKSLETNFRPVPGVSGATILGDGRVALILDVPGLLGLMGQKAVQSDLQSIRAA